MSEEDKARLYALMAVAEDTQKAAAEAVEALRSAQAASAQTVEAQRVLTASLEGVVERLEGAGPAVAATAADAVCETVRRTLQAESSGHREAVAAATTAAIAMVVSERGEELQAMTARTAATAVEVEGRLQSAAGGLGWRWMATTAAGMVAGVAAVVGAGYGVDWWQGGRIESQRATIEELGPEVARLRGLAAQLPPGSLVPCSAEGPGTCVVVDDRYSSRRAEGPEHRAIRPVYGTGYEPGS